MKLKDNKKWLVFKQIFWLITSVITLYYGLEFVYANQIYLILFGIFLMICAVYYFANAIKKLEAIEF